MSELFERLKRIVNRLAEVDEELSAEFMALAYIVQRSQDDHSNQLAREFGRRDLDLEDRLRDIEGRIRMWAETTDKIVGLLVERGMLEDEREEARTPEQADAAGV